MAKETSGLDFQERPLKVSVLQPVVDAVMKSLFLRNGLFAVCWCAAFSAAEAGVGITQPQPVPGAPLPSLCRVLDRGPVLYRSVSSWIRKVKLTLIGQYQTAAVSPNGANKFCPSSGGHNSEWRRAYLGGDVVMGDGSWRLSNLTNVGDLEGRHREVRGEWTGSRTEWSLYELYLEKTVPGIKFRAGKLTPHLTSEYCLASSRIKTVERSALCNELIPISNWGLEANFQKNARSLYHSYGIYLNANGTDLKDEIQFHSADNVFALNAMKWKVASPAWDSQTLGYQYAHNFTEWRGRKIPSTSDYCGTGAQDVISLSWDASRGAFSVMGNLLAGVGIVGQPGAKNVYGLVLQPVYRISPHLEGVFQYQCSFGNRSVKLNTRYAPSVTHYPGWVDSMHSFYLGLNCYLCPEAVNAVKLMLAVEYVTSRVDSAMAKAFNGWSVFGAVRFKF